MATFQVFSTVLILILAQNSSILVNGSAIQRSLSDDIRHGISIAGKLFGIDSPSNIAAVSNIADLVSRAFSSNNNNNVNTNHGFNKKVAFEQRPLDNIETFDGIPSHHGHDSVGAEDIIDDNVIIGGSINPSDGTTTSTDVSNGFLGNILRVLGMDTSKIGALAVNGIIFIAQMIGRSLMSAVTAMTTGGGVEVPNLSPSRQIPEKDEQQPRQRSIVDDTFGWIFEQSKKNGFLAQQIDSMLERNLPERLVRLVDDETAPNPNTDCIKQFLCKTAPIIWGMQKAITIQRSDDIDENELNEDDLDMGDKGATNDDDSRINVFFKHLPSVDEFKNHGGGCEERYSACKIFEK